MKHRTYKANKEGSLFVLLMLEIIILVILQSELVLLSTRQLHIATIAITFPGNARGCNFFNVAGACSWHGDGPSCGGMGDDINNHTVVNLHYHHPILGYLMWWSVGDNACAQLCSLEKAVRPILVPAARRSAMAVTLTINVSGARYGQVYLLLPLHPLRLICRYAMFRREKARGRMGAGANVLSLGLSQHRFKSTML